MLIAYKSRSQRVDELFMDRMSRSFEVVDIPELPGEKRGSVRLLRADFKRRGI
jgi:hypothetical protein